MYCRNCGSEISELAEVCIQCGVKKMVGSSYCPNCGEATNPGSDYCVKCGIKLAPAGEAKSRMAAGLLGIFLGGLGIHRFYLGYTGLGVVQLLVTLVTCGMGSIWGLIEGILILCNSTITKDADGRPLKD